MTRNRIAVVLCGLLILHFPAVAQTDPQISINAGKLLRSSPVCKKSASVLESGKRHGNLKNTFSVLIYYGPSVLCPPYDTLEATDRFIVVGQARSSFKKPWYQIQILNATLPMVWIPAKYVELADPYVPPEEETLKKTPSKQYPSTDLEDVIIIPSVSRYVRTCPSVSCEQVGSVSAGKRYAALKQADNGWYFVEVSDGVRGWVGGKQVKRESDIEKVLDQPTPVQPARVVEQEPTPEPVPAKPVVETIDPCTTTRRTKQYEEKHVWRVNNRFFVIAAPDAACRNRYAIDSGRALIPLGETPNHYQLAYLDGSLDQHLIGYFNKQRFDEQYVPIHPLPATFTNEDIADQLQESERYWKTWRYKLSVYWEAVKQVYRNHLISMPLLSGILLIGLLLAIPFTRPLIIVPVQVVHGMFLRRKLRTITGHWNTMIEGLTLTPSEFYDSLKAAISEKGVPDTRQVFIEWKQGGIFSPKRMYLRVKRKEFAFDICGAPFGNGTFFSWWLGELPRGFLAFIYMIPIVCWLAYLYERVIKPETYYKVDSMMMFQSLISSAVQEVIESHVKAKGLKSLTESEKKPHMKEFFSRRA